MFLYSKYKLLKTVWQNECNNISIIFFIIVEGETTMIDYFFLYIYRGTTCTELISVVTCIQNIQYVL